MFKKINQKKLSSTAGLVSMSIFGTITLLLTNTTALADSFSGPSATPPASNAPVPINETSIAQAKLGGLSLGGDLYVGGNLGVGASATAKLLVRSSSGTAHTIFDNDILNDGYSGGTMVQINNSSANQNNKYLSMTSDYDGDNGGAINFGALGLGGGNAFQI
jgi:hypothetical protein